jgi:hypothetical protein
MFRAGVIVVLGSCALSCAETGPATRAPIIEQALPTAAGEGAAGAPAAGESQTEAQGSSAPSGATTAALEPSGTPQAIGAAGAGAGATGTIAAGNATPPPATGNQIALILPLDVPEFARAAAAVRDGFLDAATAAGAKGQCVVIAQGIDGVIPAFESARERGVRVAVGPLARDDLKTLAISGARLPWTLALNQLEGDAPLPAAIYTFALSIDSDARMLARRARQDGAHSVDVIEGNSALMKRLAIGFTRAWVDAGGSAPAALPFDASPDALTALRNALVKAPPDAVLLATTGAHAALAKPFLGTVTTYASGLVFDRPSLASAHDLDGVRVAEIPWLLTPDAPAFAALQRPDVDSDALLRLYAFGFDAYRIAASFHAEPPQAFALDGATGHITLDDRRFVREAALGVYRNGQLVPLDATP